MSAGHDDVQPAHGPAAPPRDAVLAPHARTVQPAHAPAAEAPPGFGALDAGLLAAVACAGVLYALGCARVRRTAGGRRALPARRALAFAGGWLALAGALAPPLARLADVLFAAHMVQHELLVLVAPPLVVLGRPALVWLWALPRRARRAPLRPLRGSARRAFWRVLGAPLPAAALHAGVLWTWHAAPAFEWALRDDAVHAAQHATFYGSAALFWWSLLHGRFGRAGYGAAVLFVFATALHSGALGALLTVARAPWYPSHAARAAAAGHDPLADQQLAGLLMWIPAGMLFVAIALALFAAWLGEAGRRARRVALGLAALVAASTLGAAACEAPERARDGGAAAAAAAGGDPARGRQALLVYGCPVCHRIPGVPSASSRVGPPLEDLASRTFLAGHLPHTPENLRRWIQHPQAIAPGSAMPEMGVTDADARDIAAYLLEAR